MVCQVQRSKCKSYSFNSVFTLMEQERLSGNRERKFLSVKTFKGTRFCLPPQLDSISDCFHPFSKQSLWIVCELSVAGVHLSRQGSKSRGRQRQHTICRETLQPLTRVSKPLLSCLGAAVCVRAPWAAWSHTESVLGVWQNGYKWKLPLSVFCNMHCLLCLVALVTCSS